MAPPEERAREVFEARGVLADPTSIARCQYHCKVQKRTLSAARDGLSGLCIPLSNDAPGRAKGYQYVIIYDDSGRHTKDFIVAHELGHIVSKTFGMKFGTLGEAIEKWCDDFATELVRLFASDG